MKNLKKILTNNYDCFLHIEEEPDGVKDYALIDGELYTADGYEWILLNNFGMPILTDIGYEEGDISENALEFIKYLIADAPEKGYIEEATPEENNMISALLGED